MEENSNGYNPTVCCNLNDKLSENEKITFIGGSPSQLFVGTNRGIIHHVVEQNGHFAQVGTIELPKNDPVSQIEYASALNLLLIVCGDVYFEIDLEGFKTVNRKIGIRCFAVNVNPTTDDPFTIPIVFGLDSKALLFAQRTTIGFESRFKISVPSTISGIAFSGNTVCYATSDNYFLLNTDTRSTIPLCPFFGIGPFIAVVNSGEFLVRAAEELAVFVSSDGTSCRPPVILSHALGPMLYKQPEIFYISANGICFSDTTKMEMSLETVVVPEVESLFVLEGTVFLCDGRNITRLVEKSFEDKVNMLLKKKNYALAIKTYEEEVADRFSEELLLGLHNLKEKVAYIKLENKQFEEAAELFVESNSSVAQLIERIRNSTEYEENCFSKFLLEFLLEQRSSPEHSEIKQLVDTTLLELCVEHNCVDDLDVFANFTPDPAVAVDLYLKSNKFLHAAEILWAQKKWKDASEAWEKAYDQGDVICKKMLLDKISTLDLQDCDNDALLCIASRLHKHYPEAVVPILIKTTISLSDVKAALWPSAEWEDYLSNCIQTDEVYHEKAVLFIDKINKKDESYQQKFRTLAANVPRDFANDLMSLLDGPTFEVERMLIKAEGKPTEALAFILGRKRDLDGAEILLQKYTGEHPELKVQVLQLGLELLANDSFSNEPERQAKLVTLLSTYGRCSDSTALLDKLPESLRASQVGNFLKGAVTSKIADHHLNVLKLALLERATNCQNTQAMKTPSVKLTEDSRCSVCKRAFSYEEPLLFLPTGYIIHNRCQKHPRLCPVTNTLF